MLARRIAVIGALLVASCGSRDGAGIAASSPTTSPPTPPTAPIDTRASSNDPAGRVIYLLPSYLPASAEVQGTQAHSGSQDTRAAAAIAIGRAEGAVYVDVVRVYVVAAAADRKVSPNEAARLRHVEVRGVAARLSDQEVTGAAVDWFHEGRMVGVVGEAGSVDLVVQVARALDLNRQGTDVLTALPEGFVRLGAFASPGEPSPGWSTVVRTAGVSTALSVDGALVPKGSPPVLLLGGGGRLRPISIRGAAGVMSTSEVPLAGRRVSLTTISWLERPDFGITVRGGIDAETLIAVAEGLREVKQVEFEDAGEKRSEGTPPQTTDLSRGPPRSRPLSGSAR